MQPLRIAVITPYYREAEAMLRGCHESVLAQDAGADHFLVADGHARAAFDGWQARHVRLPQAHGDNGNTPRGIGGLLARNEGYDFVAYLDADNWYHDGHLRSLIELWRKTQAPVCTAFRTFHDAAGTPLGVTDADEDSLRHVDTSCFLVHRAAFGVLPVWLDMPRVLSPICDRVFLAAVMHGHHRVASTRARTVAFRSQYNAHFHAAGLAPPAGGKDAGCFAPAFDYLRSTDGVTACVAAMGFWPLSYIGP